MLGAVLVVVLTDVSAELGVLGAVLVVVLTDVSAGLTGVLTVVSAELGVMGAVLVGVLSDRLRFTATESGSSGLILFASCSSAMRCRLATASKEITSPSGVIRTRGCSAGRSTEIGCMRVCSSFLSSAA